MKAFKGNFPTFSPNWKGPKHIYCWLFHNLNPFAFGFPGLSPTGVAATSPIWWPGDSSSLLFTPVSKIYSFQIRWYNFKVNHPTMTYSGLVPDTFIKLFKFKHSVHYRQPMTSTNLGSDEAGHSSLSPGANTPPRNSERARYNYTLCNSWSYRGDPLSFCQLGDTARVLKLKSQTRTQTRQKIALRKRTNGQHFLQNQEGIK